MICPHKHARRGRTQNPHKVIRKNSCLGNLEFILSCDNHNNISRSVNTRILRKGSNESDSLPTKKPTPQSAANKPGEQTNRLPGNAESTTPPSTLRWHA